MLISILAGPRFIAFLRRKEYGQTIREEGPQHHVTKQGTPIMGGLLVLGAGTAAYLALARYTVPALTVLFVTLACGAIGFIDDFIKLTHRRSLGLNARWKLLLLGAITVGVGLAGRHRLDGDRRRAGGLRDHDEDDLPAAPDRRHLRDRGALRDPAGLLVPLLGPADIPDDADPPPLRDESLVRDEDHGPLLDRHGPALRGRLRAVLPLLPRVPLNELPERVLVLGLARSGLAAAAALERRGVEVVRADRELGNDEDVGLVEGVGLLVKSPGGPAEASQGAGARARGVPVWSEVELGSRLLPNPILGVTGTNGKTTTAEWLRFMLVAPVAGNVGRALSEPDGEGEPEQGVVVELSSVQLADSA